MNDIDLTLPMQIIAACLVAGFATVWLAGWWAERRLNERRTPRPNRGGINLNAELE